MSNYYNYDVEIPNSRFIFRTQFKGLPEMDSHRDDRRKAHIVFPSEMEEVAIKLMNEGFNVKQTKPDPTGRYEQVYYAQVIASFRFDPPAVYLLCNGTKTPLDEETIGTIDDIKTGRVYITLSKWCRDGKRNLYIQTMYVEQLTKHDPFADLFGDSNGTGEEDPF